MKNNKLSTKRTFILFSLNAVLWAVISIMKFMESSSITSYNVLTVCCAIIWTISAISQYKKYKEEIQQ